MRVTYIKYFLDGMLIEDAGFDLTAHYESLMRDPAVVRVSALMR